MAAPLYNYVVTAHKSSSVTHLLSGRFTGPDDVNLIVAKSNYLEVFQLTGETLTPRCELPLYARVASMQLYRPSLEAQDVVLVLTEKRQWFSLAYDAHTGETVTRGSGNVDDSIARPTDGGPICIVDPQCRLIGMQLYNGRFTALPMEPTHGAVREPFNMRLEEMEVLDMVFLNGCAVPTICLLYQDMHENRHVKTYSIDIKTKEFAPAALQRPNLEREATMLVPVPAAAGGGVIIVGEQIVMYVSAACAEVSVPISPSAVTSWAPIDAVHGEGSCESATAGGQRYLLGDTNGLLRVVSLVAQGPSAAGSDGESTSASASANATSVGAAGLPAVTAIHADVLGETCAASAVAYVNDGIAFVGSTFGDSQLVRLPEANAQIEVLQQYSNIGPIVDFCVMDLDRQGQGQVISCSGAGKDGSLRIVRNGIAVSEQAVIELPGIKGIWSLRPTNSATFDKYLVQSFVSEIRVLAIEGEEMEEIELGGFENSSTLLCANMAGDFFVQVTSNSVRLIACTTCELVSSWSPSDNASISVAGASATQVVVSVGDGRLILLEVEQGKVVARAETQVEHEVSCIDLTPVADGSNVCSQGSCRGADDGTEVVDMDIGSTVADPTSAAAAAFCVIGLWTDISVRVLELPTLQEVSKECLGGEMLPRSVLLAKFGGMPYLLVGMGDGVLVTFSFDSTSGALAGRKNSSLGTQPVTLCPFHNHRRGTFHIFAASDRPAVISSEPYSARKMLFSNVNVQEAGLMASFHSEAFPDSLAIASESQLVLGALDDIQKLHVDKVPLGEAPRRIVQHVASRTFAVATTRALEQPADDEPEAEQHSVCLFDDTAFECASHVTTDAHEHVLSLCTCTFEEEDACYVVVGTAFVYADEHEPTSGRILLYRVDGRGSDARLARVAIAKVGGGVYCMQPFRGKLLVAVNGQVLLLKLGEHEGGGGAKAFSKVCEHQGHFVCLNIQTRGDLIVIGDLMKSVCALQYDEPTGTIVETATHFEPRWMTALAVLDDDTFLGAENWYNIFTVQRNINAPSEEERGRLENVGEFHAGELINGFQRGSLAMHPTDSILSKDGKPMPCHLFGTVNGVLGAVITVPPDTFNLLYRLQQALKQVVTGIGGLSHDKWREFATDRKSMPARNFLDGDLIEQFLDLRQEQMQEVATIMNKDDGDGDTAMCNDSAASSSINVDYLLRVVEEMHQLH